MNKLDDKMKLINFIRPVLTLGRHTVKVTQKVTEPQVQDFSEEEDFYVSGRAYTLDSNDLFSVSPSENECGDFSRLLPFITLENKTFPWERKIADDIGTTPVPWVALIVISSKEKSEEKDIPISELQKKSPGGIFSPEKPLLPPLITENESDLCHIVDIPIELYHSIMPDYEDMTYLTHVRRVNLADTEDDIAVKDGDFSVIMANRFIPTGEDEKLKSTVHLVSLLGIPKEIPGGNDFVRMVSLHRWNVYSVKDHSETFQQLIDDLRKNTGVIGYDNNNEVLRRCYVPKKHMTRSGETTYSLYRSPLIPYADKITDCSSKYTADGHLIYDPQTGIFDVSYAAAFQLGRLISINRGIDSRSIDAWRKNQKTRSHKALLNRNIKFMDIREICKKIIEEMD